MRGAPACLILLAAGCMGRVTVREMHRTFAAEEATLRPALATSSDFRPLRMEDALPMRRTILLGELYLEQRPRDNLNRDFVSALLANAYLTHGRVAEAQKLARRLVVPGPNSPELERGVIERTKWLVGACRAMQGRLDIDELALREDGVVEFLELYGPLVGYNLPRPQQRDYLKFLERYTLDLQRTLFAPEPRSPRQLEARTRRLQEMRRLLAEQVYNDSAALKQTLAPANERRLDATDRFFSMALSSLYVTISYLSDDLVPRVHMEESQKQWIREQALSTYEAVRALARHYVPESRMKELETGLVPGTRATPKDCRERLYARLYVAEKEVLAWITIREG